jgi:carboxyl-terminal processing protease
MRSSRMSPKGIGVFVATFALALTLSLYGSPREVSSADRETYESLENFNTIMAIVRKNYVDDVEARDLIDSAIKGMVSSLDPHSAYLTPDAYKELKIETRGEFGGLGIEITVRDDIITIVTPIDGTPAFEAGVMPGDQIIKIDGDLTKDMNLQEAVDKMRGKPGSTVVLTVHREGATQLIDIEIRREIIHIDSVKGVRLIEDRFGYLRLTNFQEGSASELVEALETLTKEAGGKLDGLVLDLRYNPGGLLNQAVSISNLFLDAGIIVSTDGRMETQKEKYLARAEGTLEPTPMVVLINGGSASASEIVAGALKDHGRAVLVGTKSFGKGSVQSILQLSEDHALRLTTARYYTPSGISIHHSGIQPDVEIELPVPEIDPDDPKPPIPLRRDEEFVLEDDAQLLKAIELLRGWEGDIRDIGGVAGFHLPKKTELAADSTKTDAPAAAAAH